MDLANFQILHFQKPQKISVKLSQYAKILYFIKKLIFKLSYFCQKFIPG